MIQLIKLFPKSLVDRLKIIMPDIVADYQNAFVSGRLMVDNCHKSSELMSYVRRKKKGKQCANILVDLSKAYHRIRRDFLEEVLVAMAFPKEWMDSNDHAVCINRLTPHLFILCMEVLSRRLLKKKLSSLRMVRSTVNLASLFLQTTPSFVSKPRFSRVRSFGHALVAFVPCKGNGQLGKIVRGFLP